MNKAELSTLITKNFDFDGSGITTIIDEDSNPWWVASEICKILDLEPRDSVRYLDDDEKMNVFIKRLQNPGRGGDTGRRIIITRCSSFC